MPDPNDLAGWNRGTQTFNDNLDKLFKTYSKGYQWITPDFVDEGVTNFFSILRYWCNSQRFVAVNSHQSGRMQAVSDNTTAGVGVC